MAERDNPEQANWIAARYRARDDMFQRLVARVLSTEHGLMKEADNTR